MTTSLSPLPLQTRWKPYLAAACFVLPALVLWSMSAVFFAPKLEDLWRTGGGMESDAQWVMDVVMFLVRHGVQLLAGLIVVMVGFELKAGRWARYRKLALGSIVLIINTTVLSGIWCMCLAALLIAPQMMKPH
jgi:hypothetical protein